MIVLAVIAAAQVCKIGDSLTTIIDVNSVKQRYAINFRRSVHDRAIALRDVTLVDDRDLPAVLARIEERPLLWDGYMWVRRQPEDSGHRGGATSGSPPQ